MGLGLELGLRVGLARLVLGQGGLNKCDMSIWRLECITLSYSYTHTHRCKRANDRVSEAKYPVLNKDGSDSPVVLGRIKRIKSMQPKPLVEEITRSLGEHCTYIILAGVLRHSG